MTPRVPPLCVRSRVAVFVVRAWYDEGRFRARMTHTVGDDLPRAELTADAAVVAEQLRLWLGEVAVHGDDETVAE
jgi:hypothetical protein